MKPTKYQMAWICLVALLSSACGSSPPNEDPPDKDPVTHGSAVDTDTKWEGGKHILEGSLTVTNGTLEVGPCATIEMPAGSKITVGANGALKWIGTAACPIVVTSAAATPQPGDWQMIDFTSNANHAASVFQYVIVEYAGGNQNGAIRLRSGASLAMSNSTARHSAYTGMQLAEDAHLTSFNDNTLHQNANGAIELFANSVDDLLAGTYAPNTVEGIRVKGDEITHDATWRALGAPYLIDGDLEIQSLADSAILTIEAGVTLKMASDSAIFIDLDGGLVAQGSTQAPIRFVADSDTPSAGHWLGFTINGDAKDGQLTLSHVTIEHCGDTNQGCIWLDSGVHLAMNNTSVRHAAGIALELEEEAGLIGFSDNTLTDNGSHPISLGANSCGDLQSGTYTPNGAEGILVRDETITKNATWAALDTPYYLEYGLFAETDNGTAHITISGGAELQLGDGAAIVIGKWAALNLDGSPGNRVRLTSGKSSPAAGDWQFIEIAANASDCSFSHTDIRYGGGSSQQTIQLKAGAQLTIASTIISDSEHACDIQVPTGATLVDNGGNTFTSCD